jgi:hypothetical protein
MARAKTESNSIKREWLLITSSGSIFEDSRSDGGKRFSSEDAAIKAGISWMKDLIEDSVTDDVYVCSISHVVSNEPRVTPTK